MKRLLPAGAAASTRSASRRSARVRLPFALALVAAGLGGASPLSAFPQDPWSDPPGEEERDGSVRGVLAERGIFLAFANTTDLFANVTGGADRNAHVANLFEVGLLLELGRLVGLAGGRVYALGAATHGSDPGELTGTVHAPSNLAADDAFRLFELWYEQSFFRDRLGILAGLYAADSEFDVKGTAGLFVNGGFGIGLDLSETGHNGPSIFPVTSLGVRVRATPVAGLSLRAAVLDGVPGDPDDPTATGFHLGGGDGALLLGEASFEPASGPFLRIGLGGWAYTTDFEDLVATTPSGDPLVRSGTAGGYGFIEGILFDEPGAPRQGLSGFLRLGLADADVNRIASSVAVGFVYTGAVPGRDDDVLGLGISVARNGDPYRRAQAGAGLPVGRSETVLELTYLAQLLPVLVVQPIVQFGLNPDSDPALEDSLALGLRVGIVP